MRKCKGIPDNLWCTFAIKYSSLWQRIIRDMTIAPQTNELTLTSGSIRSRTGTTLLAVVLCLLFHPSAIYAQPAVQQQIAQLDSIADKARLAVVNNPSLAAFEIEFMIKEAIKKATAIYPNDVPAARKILKQLEPDLGPLKEIPSFDLHLLLSAMAGVEGDFSEQNYHRAFAVALMRSLVRSGDALSQETAPKIVMIVEEYNWFFLKKNELERETRVTRRDNGKVIDVWIVKTKDGKEMSIYFDASLMQESGERVLNNRKSNSKKQGE